MNYFPDICTLCLVSNQNLKSILSQDTDGTAVEEKLKVFLMELIYFIPNIPKYICNNCLDSINYIYKFRLRCLENITSLNKYVQRIDTNASYTNLSETKYVTDHPFDPLNTNCNEISVQKTSLQSNVAIKNEYECNEITENNQRTAPPENITIKIEEIEDSTENSKQYEHNLQTPYEVFEEFNEEKYIDENLISSISNNKVSAEPSINIKQEEEDDSEHFDNESDDEYLPSSSSSEVDNSDLESRDLKISSKIAEAIKSDATKYGTEGFANIYNKADQTHGPKNPNTDILLNKPNNTEKPVPEDRPHKCSQCPKAYTYKCKLIIHERVHTGDRPFKCDLCDAAFTENGSLKVHKKKHLGLKPHACEICGKTFTLQHFLMKHKVTHSGEKPHKCEVCNKWFSRFDYLIQHKRLHSGDLPFECQICSKAFNRASSLLEHSRIHTGEKPFSCEICNKSFAQKSNLMKHKRIHTGVKPFECDICHNTFTEKNSLRIHKRIHSGEKIFKCDVCDKAFYQSGHLMRHKNLHTDEKPFECTMCSFRGKSNNNLRLHVQRMHK